MAKPSRGPFAKRQKELSRQEKQNEKRARRLEASKKTPDGVALDPDEDPDIAGIQLGPQPTPFDDFQPAGAGLDNEPPDGR